MPGYLFSQGTNEHLVEDVLPTDVRSYQTTDKKM